MILFELLKKPFFQVLFFILLTIVCVFIIRPKNTDKTWTLAGIIFIGFMLVNAVMICYAVTGWAYFFYSLLFAILYLCSISIILPALIKLLKIEGTDESAMVFIFIMYHPVCLLLMLFLKWAYLTIT
ncbi:hypothetical protein [Cytophaga hutchinsonii]|uniref:Uncharacterized protein n=1 Tax=Cytophaga hutchinsonii (strain ATCC 33406 / DSM 1761 / CIP 103989 / NBRC 15051 / NCIMB 9469 / D465) TaxID=269798 RepID=A0A6N4SRZ8_CYTH3|nr:hypothetical protein [Cytophaga hutchinsonii]ABG59098.1 conserved hypothetical protein [Cytophaga hutchinsonii ATCC 33406]SFX36906.1 hypothetical protein SAMN04487930_103210 [Cytophaga hutchinsonii ATCC 33406]